MTVHQKIAEQVRRHETAYCWAVKAVHCSAVRTATGLPARRAARKHLSGGDALIADIRAPMGMGGILSWSGRALEMAERLRAPVGVRFSAPTYQPDEPVADWLDSYFVRTRPCPRAAAVLSASALPLARTWRIPELAPRVWEYLSIRPEMICQARGIPFSDYAAVHFRGGDKYLEAPRVPYELVLRRVEEQMRQDGLYKLFVASDEPGFVALAREHFGSDCWSLPLRAVTVDGRPPHFSDIPGQTKAEEALTTMTLLAGSRLCVRTESLMSEWAMTLPGDRRVVLVGPNS
ncbi:MAG TPA: hypothetical protein VHV82_22680 [Sporichthyaceae bacterium]|jgi:hypothetical protein|nr:hypothetical protein [Sporichthyaceae bacterium]